MVGMRRGKPKRVWRIVAAVAAGLPTVCAAGAWRLDNDEQLSITTIEAFEANAGQRRFEQMVLRSYSEIAAGTTATLGLQLASAWQEASGPGYTNLASGISEAEIFAIHHFARSGGRARAIKLTGILGTSKFIDDSRVMGQDAAIALSGLAGQGNERFFVDSEVQARMSLGDDADQLRVNITGGLKHKGAMLLVQSFNTKSFSATAQGGTDFDLGQVSVSAVVPLWRGIALELGGRQDIYTRNIDAGTTAFLAVWWRA